MPLSSFQIGADKGLCPGHFDGLLGFVKADAAILGYNLGNFIWVRPNILQTHVEGIVELWTHLDSGAEVLEGCTQFRHLCPRNALLQHNRQLLRVAAEEELGSLKAVHVRIRQDIHHGFSGLARRKRVEQKLVGSALVAARELVFLGAFLLPAEVLLLGARLQGPANRAQEAPVARGRREDRQGELPVVLAALELKRPMHALSLGQLHIHRQPVGDAVLDFLLIDQVHLHFRVVEQHDDLWRFTSGPAQEFRGSLLRRRVPLGDNLLAVAIQSLAVALTLRHQHRYWRGAQLHISAETHNVRALDGAALGPSWVRVQALSQSGRESALDLYVQGGIGLRWHTVVVHASGLRHTIHLKSHHFVIGTQGETVIHVV
mmetsp:Transcript_8714/g.19109  ORF Transcript_8714/g.19109 Transcript_8714/m.19109 type:complete len:374 (-) Transcript_8714:635-1756(-)